MSEPKTLLIASTRVVRCPTVLPTGVTVNLEFPFTQAVAWAAMIFAALEAKGANPNPEMLDLERHVLKTTASIGEDETLGVEFTFGQILGWAAMIFGASMQLELARSAQVDGAIAEVPQLGVASRIILPRGRKIGRA